MGQQRDLHLLSVIFDRFGPVVSLDDAAGMGLPASLLRRGVDAGVLVRVAKAAFVRRADLAGLTPWEAFRLRAIGFGLCTGPEIHLAGWAAGAVLRIPTVHSPPTIPTALRPGSARRGADRTPYGWTRTGYLPEYCRTVRDRVATVDSSFTVIDLARHYGPVAGVVAADFVLHQGVHREILARLTDDLINYPGIEIARWVVERADARAESPLESLGRLAFLTAKREPPLSNVWIDAGYRQYRIDHLLQDSGVVLEADGALKYDNRPDAGRVVDAEKDRERTLRRLGFEVVRYNYDIAVRRPGELLRRVDEAARWRGHRPVPHCWSLDPPENLSGWRRAE